MESTQPQKRKIARIVVDRDLCIGAATCVALAPDTFEMDGENKAIVKELAPHTDDELMTAIESCPTKAIFAYDADGKQVYP